MIEFTFTLQKHDFLIFQQFNASKIRSLDKRRKGSRLIFAVIYLVLGYYMIRSEKTGIGLAFIAFGFVWFFYIPTLLKKRYEKMFEKFANENFKSSFDKEVQIQIDDEFIYLKDESFEGKMKLENIEIINEISTHIFIKMHEGQTYILPKSKIDNIDSIKTFLLHLSEKLQIHYIEELDWKW